MLVFFYTCISDTIENQCCHISLKHLYGSAAPSGVSAPSAYLKNDERLPSTKTIFSKETKIVKKKRFVLRESFNYTKFSRFLSIKILKKHIFHHNLDKK